MTIPDFYAARQPCPTQDELRVLSERAHDEAAGIMLKPPHAAWELERAAWLRLAEAAYVCQTILVRRHLSFVSTPAPPPKEAP